MEDWQLILRTPDGDATYNRWTYEQEVTEFDAEADRPPFSDLPFFLGTGLEKPTEIQYRVRLHAATLGDADIELSNLLYVLDNVTHVIHQDRIRTAKWTNSYQKAPLYNGYIVTFNLTIGESEAFTGTIEDIADPPPTPTPTPAVTGDFAVTGGFPIDRIVGNQYLFSEDGSITAVRVKLTTVVTFNLVIWSADTFARLHYEAGFTSVANTDAEFTLSSPVAVTAGSRIIVVGFVNTSTSIYEERNSTWVNASFSTHEKRFAMPWPAASIPTKYPNVETLPNTTQYAIIPVFAGGEGAPPPPTSDPDPTPVGGLVLAMPALGDFQARGGAGTSKVAYSQFSRVFQAQNRTFDAGSPSNFNHPSIGSFAIRQSVSDKLYFFCYTEIFEITDAATLSIVSRGSNGFGVATYDRNFQWSRANAGHYYGVKNGDLMKATTLGSPVTICSRSRVLSELSLTAYDSQAVRWGGPAEGTIVSNTDGLGKEMAMGYVRTGEKALTVFAYNVTDDTILSTVQNITFTTEAELYFDFIATSVQGDYGIMKARPQSSSLDVQYWIFPLTLSGVGTRILGDASIDVGHSAFGLTKDGSNYIDGFYTFTSETFNLLDLSDGSVGLTKSIEGQWSQHIGHVYWTHGFTSYDSSGFAAFEFSDGSGGYGLGDGWDTQGYLQMYYDNPTGDVFVMGRRNGVPEVRYWDAP